MNSLVISDLHAHTWSRFATTTPEGRNSRLQDLLDILAQAKAYAEAHAVTDLLLGGDLFHRRHFITWGLYADVMESLMDLINEVDHTVMLVGNHDWEDDRAHALLPFRYVGPEVDVVDRPDKVTLSDASALYCIPYSYHEDAVVAAFAGAPAGVPVFSHFAASGVPLESDYYLDSVVKLEDLHRFPYVLFGHVHRPSAQCAHCGHTLEGDPLTPLRPCDRCKRESGRALYVGAPMHFDFGDVGARYMLHLRGHTAVRVPLRAPEFATTRWPRIPPPAAPGFLQILNVPPDRVVSAQERARAVGWRGALAIPAPLPEAVAAQMAETGLQITEGLLADYVVRRYPMLDDEERRATVAEGVRFLQEARR